MPENISWFPGHMVKTKRQIKENLPLVDGVAELRDARIPLSSSNSELNELIKNKPKIILLNKADLADEKITAEWLSFFASRGRRALAVDCKSGKGLNLYKKAVKESLADKIKSNVQKGMSGRALRIMAVGIPNTGKSSFINRLAKNSKAKVEDRAGVTLRSRWYVIDKGIELLDTPGVLPPKFDNPDAGGYLAFTGGIKDEILDIETLSLRLLDILTKNYADRLAERYNIENFGGMTSFELLDYIGRKRGMLMSGGEIDTLRVAEMLFDELRAGRLGRISFERPKK